MTKLSRLTFHRILLLLALGIAGLQSFANAAPNTFSLTGNPIAGRERNSATLLPDGKVLVTGGTGDGGQPLATAELYDPATGKWAPTGSMAEARHYYHAAVLLPNGKVLVSGGATVKAQTVGAELYDPATGVWTATGSMKTARNYHTLTVLADGRVLAVGGFGSSGGIGSLPTAEIYDPATEQWTATGSPREARRGHSAALLPDGRVLIVAGSSGGSIGVPLATAELYDPVTGTWTPTGSLAGPLAEQTATALQDGTVLVAGGFENGYTLSAATQIYSPATGLWTASGNLVSARVHHSATLLASGRVLLAGGWQWNDNVPGNDDTRCEVYDPATGTCTAVGHLGSERDKHSATLLPNGKVLITGGHGYPSNSRTSELFDPADGKWNATGDLTEPRFMHMAIRLTDGKVLVAGGQDSHSHSMAAAELYDPATGHWAPAGVMGKARWLSPPVLLADGRVLFPAGEDEQGKMKSAELYEPATGTWRTTGSLAAARGGHTATLLADGRVLVAGGVGMTSAELYDPATEQWTPTGDLGKARSNHVAVLLPSGQVLVAGGSSEGGAELYDPVQGTWTPTGSPAYSIYGWRAPSAFLLPTGKVLYFGGGTDTILNNAELYDPATGTWTTTAGVNRSSNYFAATQLSNGQVLVAGGNTNDTAATAAIYDAASGTWKATGSLVGEHLYHTLTPLLDGRVLATAGIAFHTGFTASTELFDPGFGFPKAARPQIASVTPLRIGAPLSLTGSGLLGLAAGNSGNGLESSTTFPLVQVRSLSNGQSSFLLPAANSARSATAYVSKPLSGLLRGPVEVTVIANGVPSAAFVARLEAGLPTVTTGTTTNPSISGVTLHADASALGALTQVTFEYSTDAAFQQKLTTAAVTLPLSAVHSSVSQALAGLSPHTTYYYRAVATNSAGTTVGEIASYTTGNTPPAAPESTATAATGAAQTITLDFPATDPDGDAVTLTRAVGDANLTVTGINGRRVSFTIAEHFAGTATIAYDVSDGGRTATGHITVTIADEAPVITLAGANPLVLGYAVPFVEPGVTALDAVDGALAVAATGSVDPTTAGDYALTYSVTDSAGHTVTATRTVTVSPAPAPVARADRYFTADTRKTPLVLHVLDNDTAYVPASLLIVSVTAPKQGTASIAADGHTITYTPRVAFASFATDDTFTYTIRDNFGVNATAQVAVGNSARQLKGVYDGLLGDGAVNVGYVRLSLTTTGNWTGTLVLGTTTKPILGRFDLENSARITVAGSVLTLRLADTGISATLGARISGTLTRASFDAAHHTLKAGRYTVLLPAPLSAGAPPDTVPAGAGYAIMVVSPAGIATLTGRGGDGNVWAASGFLKESNGEVTMALYSIIRYLPGPSGTLSGTITFRDLAAISDCDGPLAWIKPPQTGTAPYAGGFSVTVPALGSRYVAPAGQQALAFSNRTFGAGSLTMSGADLISPINGSIAVRKNNTVSETSSPGNRLALNISAGSGLFSGTITGHFQLGAQTRTAQGIIRGVLFQKQNLGQGHFIGPMHSGELNLIPQ